ncbi:hypothetical protein M271_25795 [Streptomyces rapamycinicus NRRL 5491]|nr:hypothetical protein M271_25795 [Streptomyces rapamycinicus NRRL 5491]
MVTLASDEPLDVGLFQFDTVQGSVGPKQSEVELVPQGEVAAGCTRQELATKDPSHPLDESLQVTLAAVEVLDDSAQLIQVGLPSGPLYQSCEQLSLIQFPE